VNADQILLIAVGVIVLLAFGCLIVAARSISVTDRFRFQHKLLTDRIATAEAKAAKYQALAGLSVVDPRPPAEDLTVRLPRVNERHDPPVSQGGTMTIGDRARGRR